MTMDLCFETGRFTGKTEAGRNPFVPEQQVPVQAPLSPAETKAVRQVIEAAAGPDDVSCYYVQFDELGSAEILFSDLKYGCTVDVGGISPSMTKFLFDLLVAGSWMMVDPQREPSLAFTTSAGKAKLTKLPDDLRVVVCDSAQELGKLMAKSDKAITAYLAQAAGQPAATQAKTAARKSAKKPVKKLAKKTAAKSAEKHAAKPAKKGKWK